MGNTRKTVPRRRGKHVDGRERGDSSNASVSGVVPIMAPAPLPLELIEYVGRTPTIHEPPRKRQKTTVDRHTGGCGHANHLDYILVWKHTYEIECEGTQLAGFGRPLQREGVTPAVSWGNVEDENGRPRFDLPRVPNYIDIMDEEGRPLYRTPLSKIDASLDDITLALNIDRESRKAPKTHGSLWTEFNISLFHKKGSGLDCIQLVFAVKWAVIKSPSEVARYSNKTPSLLKVLSSYFPDLNVLQSEWTPQDFYQAVYQPARDAPGSSIETDLLDSTLYPFQKRAVSWLMERERGGSYEASGLPVSFLKTKDFGGRECYVSHLFGCVTTSIGPFEVAEKSLRGGLLSEAMGLGKSVEVIALISLHKDARPSSSPIFDEFTGEIVRPTSATLIITPPSILKQWMSEIQKHAPSFKVFYYEGLNAKAHGKSSHEELLGNMASSDIVVSTYSVLAAELHYTPVNAAKSLRRPPKYARLKSPLVQFSWWRVCMDEAQMIESGVSNAAVVARIIPRMNAWCITGTPVRKDVNDLLGLLIFLRYEPYSSAKHIWGNMISWHKYEFKRLFRKIALRHSKRSVRDELKLPAQQRYVITMPFTPIEEQHYQELFDKMCGEIGVDLEGSPLIDNWDPDAMAEKMRSWLVRLRQAALHPEVGGRNRRALGQRGGPLRTVDEVLDVMIFQSDLAIRTDQRAVLISRLKRGQLYENSPRVKEALEIWDAVAKDASEIVDECRKKLQQETGMDKAEGKSSARASRATTESDSDEAEDKPEDDMDPSSRLGVYRMRLRVALEVLHVAIFFRANAYFQIKSNEEMTKPDTPEFQSLEKLEVGGYEEAKELRREILQEVHQKAEKLMKRVSKNASTQAFVEISEFPSSPPKGGIESRRIMEQLDALATALDAQANTLDDWREQTIQFLLRPLVDEEDSVEITGDEYENSTKTQEEVMVFVQALRAVIADRHDALTGQKNRLIEYEVMANLRAAKEGNGPFPEKTANLYKTRQQLKPTKDMGSMRGIVVELRGLATSLRQDAESGSSRAQNEFSIVEKQLHVTQKDLKAQTKTTTALEKEVEQFTALMNRRLDYYRQLQQVSDMVAPYEGPNSDKVVQKMLDEEERLQWKIATSKSKLRYLEHLRLEAANPQDQRICVICREDFEVGSLTVCGHQYCKECIRLWWHSHHNCPVCKKKLTLADLHEVTYKPQVLSIQAEDIHETLQEHLSPSKSRKSSIYSEVSKNRLAEIKNIELNGPSFTTKVDTLARHIIWLRETDPGAKSIIYSQFKDFLEVLAQAFQKFRIGFSSIDKSNGIEKFKNDPGVECFLLHARAHSSGLNLVNASHVFLCEPLLNTALELQAIARVDRIGQHQETNVWLYLVDGTVEESIHQLSVKRRMEHMGNNMFSGKGNMKELTPDELLDTKLEEANSMELQNASLTRLLAKGGKGGEMVEKEDLWDCLFGGASQRKTNRAIDNHGLRFDQEIRRHLGAEAAEQRQNDD